MPTNVLQHSQGGPQGTKHTYSQGIDCTQVTLIAVERKNQFFVFFTTTSRKLFFGKPRMVKGFSHRAKRFSEPQQVRLVRKKVVAAPIAGIKGNKCAMFMQSLPKPVVFQSKRTSEESESHL